MDYLVYSAPVLFPTLLEEQYYGTQESNTERKVLGKRKNSFIEEAGNHWEKVDSSPKEPTPHCQSGGKSF